MSRLSLFSRYHLAGLTCGARRVKKHVAKIFSIFVDGNIGISALEVAKNRTLMKISIFFYFDDIIRYSTRADLKTKHGDVNYISLRQILFEIFYEILKKMR